jgi:hypothetical protein
MVLENIIKSKRKKGDINGIGVESPIYLSGPGCRIFYQAVAPEKI